MVFEVNYHKYGEGMNCNEYELIYINYSQVWFG